MKRKNEQQPNRKENYFQEYLILSLAILAGVIMFSTREKSNRPKVKAQKKIEKVRISIRTPIPKEELNGEKVNQNSNRNIIITLISSYALGFYLLHLCSILLDRDTTLFLYEIVRIQKKSIEESENYRKTRIKSDTSIVIAVDTIMRQTIEIFMRNEDRTPLEIFLYRGNELDAMALYCSLLESLSNPSLLEEMLERGGLKWDKMGGWKARRRLNLPLEAEKKLEYLFWNGKDIALLEHFFYLLKLNIDCCRYGELSIDELRKLDYYNKKNMIGAKRLRSIISLYRRNNLQKKVEKYEKENIRKRKLNKEEDIDRIISELKIKVKNILSTSIQLQIMLLTSSNIRPEKIELERQEFFNNFLKKNRELVNSAVELAKKSMEYRNSRALNSRMIDNFFTFE